MPQIVSANDLATGAVVFLDEQGRWADSVDAAASFADRDAAEVALLTAPQAGVVDPFVVERKADKVGAAAMTLRNAIRAYGPTIDYRLFPSKPSPSSGPA